MDTRLRAFRSFEPFEGYPVRDLAFSATGDRILVCTGSASVKVSLACNELQGTTCPMLLHCVGPLGLFWTCAMLLHCIDPLCLFLAHFKVVDRDGMELLETKKGDAYLFDLARTAGHVSSVNSGCWHPRNGSLFMTCSNDSTVRLLGSKLTWVQTGWEEAARHQRRCAMALPDRSAATRASHNRC